MEIQVNVYYLNCNGSHFQIKSLGVALIQPKGLMGNIFTVPVTGTYLIHAQVRLYQQSTHYLYMKGSIKLCIISNEVSVKADFSLCSERTL